MGNSHPLNPTAQPSSDDNNAFLRNADLSAICIELRNPDSKYPVIVICGEPGIGKTRLAHEAKLQVEDVFTSVFVSVRRSVEGEEKRSVLPDIFRQITNELDQEDINRWPLSTQYDKVLVALARQPTLLVLDNLDGLADSLDEIWKLLNNLPETVRAIVTTKNCDFKYQKPYLPVPLKTLSKQDCFRLAVHEFIEITDEQKDVLWEEVAPNPLAIELSVARLKQALKNNLLGPGDIEALRKLLNPNGSLQKLQLDEAISLSIAAIDDPDALNVLLAFVLFSGDADIDALRAVVDIPATDSGRRLLLKKAVILKTLRLIQKVELPKGLNVELVRRKVVQNEIRLELRNPTIGETLRNKLKQNPSQEDVFRERWINFYMTLRDDKSSGWTIFSDYLVKSDLFPKGRNFKPEMTNILRAIQYCLYENSEKYWRHAAKMVDDFRETFFSLGYWERREQYCLDILRDPMSLRDDQVRARVLRLLAWTYCFQSNFVQAEKRARQALKLVREQLSIEDLQDKDLWRQTLYKALDTLGQITLRNRTANIITENQTSYEAGLKTAQGYFSDALLIVSLYSHDELFAVQFHLAEVKYEFAKYEQRQADLSYAAKEFIDANTTWKTKAEPLWNEVRDILKKILDNVRSDDSIHHRAEAHVLYYLGKISRRGQDPEVKKQFNGAREYFKQSLEIADLYGDRVLGARIRFALGQLEYADKNLSKSKELVVGAYRELVRFRMLREYEDAENFMKRKGLDFNDEAIKGLNEDLLGEDYSPVVKASPVNSERKTVFRDKTILANLLFKRFNLDELNLLIDDLKIDVDSISGGRLETRIRELLNHLARYDMQNDLLDNLKRLRSSQENWDSQFTEMAS